MAVPAYRVSNVESFRRWETDEDADTASLVADILGQGEESEAMRAGTALHLALETASAGERDCLEVPGYRFVFDGDFNIALAGVRELRASKTYMVDGEPIRISGKVDALEGRRIEDHKTTARFDPERYLTGYQWRLYLSIFGADHFRWNVFEMSSDGFDADEVSVYRVFAQHRLEQWRYPAMEEDCQRLVERFARFVRDNVYGEVPELETA